jgi:hypothetical protein
MSLFTNGLFGMGGPSGLSSQNGLQGLLGQYYNPQEMQGQKLKNGLLQAGIAMMGQPNSNTPINFGQSLAAGLAGGVKGADDAQRNYTDNALMARQVENQNADQSWQNEQHGYQRAQWDKARADQEATDAWIAQQPADKQRLYRAFPELAGKAAIKQEFGATDGSSGYFGNTLPMQDENGNFAGWGLAGKDGGSAAVPPPAPGMKWMSPYDKAAQTSGGTAGGKARAEMAFEMPMVASSINADIQKINELIAHPGLQGAVGTFQGSQVGQLVTGVFSNDVADFKSRVAQIKGGAFLQAYKTLKGGGAIANAEGTKAEQAIARLDTAKSEADFVTALNDYKFALARGFQAMQDQMNGAQPQPIGSPGSSDPSVDDLLLKYGG